MAATKKYYWTGLGADIFVVYLNPNRTVTTIGKIGKAPSPGEMEEIKVSNGRERKASQ